MGGQKYPNGRELKSEMGLAQRLEIEKLRSHSNNSISAKEVAARLANDRIGAATKESLQRTILKHEDTMRKLGRPPRVYKKLAGPPSGDGVAGARIEKLAEECEMLKRERRQQPADHMTTCLVPICPLNLPHDNWRRNTMTLASNIPTARSNTSGRTGLPHSPCSAAIADELAILRERVAMLEETKLHLCSPHELTMHSQGRHSADAFISSAHRGAPHAGRRRRSWNAVAGATWARASFGVG